MKLAIFLNKLDMQINSHHCHELVGCRIVTDYNAHSMNEINVLFLSCHCIVLYLYIYIALLAVHTKQKPWIALALHLSRVHKCCFLHNLWIYCNLWESLRVVSEQAVNVISYTTSTNSLCLISCKNFFATWVSHEQFVVVTFMTSWFV